MAGMISMPMGMERYMLAATWSYEPIQ
jgi:hypothetical protein